MVNAFSRIMPFIEKAIGWGWNQMGEVGCALEKAKHFKIVTRLSYRGNLK